MKTKEEFFKQLNTKISVLDYIDPESVESFDDVLDQLEDNGAFDAEGEVIYYSHAMDYLKENDPSLQESLEIAGEMGYTPETLDSEILASLLKAQKLREDFYEHEDEITEFFENLQS